MKIKLLSTLAVFLVASLTALSQQQFTPYDELPGIDKIYKPAFDKSYAGWKKMLYQFPINFFEIELEFKNYQLQHQKEKSPVIRYYKIWRRAVEPLVNHHGEIILPDIPRQRQKLYNRQKNAGLVQKSATSGSSYWTFLGPKETFWKNEETLNEAYIGPDGNPEQCPWQANVYSFDVYAQNQNILYCGTETGYVNKTNNKGLTWEMTGKNYPFGGGVPAVAIHPENENIVYVSAGNQVHKTTDGGETWQPLLSSGNQFSAVRLKFHPDNYNFLVAASSSGIFITTDGGAGWTKKWSSSTWDVEFKPGNPEVIYGLTKNNSGKFQIVVSENEGISFQTNSEFPENYTEASGGLLAVTPAKPDMLLATLLAKENDDGIPFVLKGIKDEGQMSWTEIKRGEYNSVGGLGGFTNGQGYFDLVFEIAPDNEDIVFWGTCTLFKSTDGGVTFSKVGGYGGEFPVHPDIQDMQILPGGETWVATDGGMNYSTDHFTSIKNYSSRTKGIIGSDMWGFDQGWNEDLIVGGRYHNGNTAMADFYDAKSLRMGGAESPTGWVLQGKSRHVAFNDLGNGWILPETAEGFSEGRFIFSKFPNMDEYGARRSNLVHHPNYYGTLFLGEGNGVWKSTDLGETYDLLHQFPNRVRFLQISPKNPDFLYVDIVGNGLYKSEDGGKSWEHKPALTSGQYGDASWGGKLFFVISPAEENKIYVCLQNGAWSADKGQIFVSEDGGNTWSDFTGGVDAYTKCMAIQPDTNGNDLLYLFTNSRNSSDARVYYRYESQPYWNEFNNHYPAGMMVNLALPFYRDSKLRVSGNAGIWESPLAETEFVPVINPWVEKPLYNCMEDTLYFDDHSILNHEGVAWKWEISPEPEFISNQNTRNPKVVLGTAGKYDVTLEVTKNGQIFSKTIHDMVTTTTCPSVYDCTNPAKLNKEEWSLIYTDSEETTGEDGNAKNAFDGNPDTFWHTEWYYNEPGQPHEIQIDLGREYKISSVTYLPRQNSANGRIKAYELFVSTDNFNWGTAVSEGSFEPGASPKKITFPAKEGQYVKFNSLSEQNGNPFTTVTELSITGCISNNSTSTDLTRVPEIDGYPIPAREKFTVSLPFNGTSNHWVYQIFASSGKIVMSDSFNNTSSSHTFSVNGFEPGIYFILLKNQKSATYRVKFVKQ